MFAALGGSNTGAFAGKIVATLAYAVASHVAAVVDDAVYCC